MVAALLILLWHRVESGKDTRQLRGIAATSSQIFSVHLTLLRITGDFRDTAWHSRATLPYISIW
ncbi:hypothetical protein KDA_59750 [Dictyobacter alpinus]|uniref:Uncharacterized protein n=1 Tax=Dictyobacter alpinus TaxID=2014873 RepID=A0A402BGF9_9CHLR|nr:hypothetical protein KDA_59750 [Dictyobacter alpinus]